MIVQPNQSTLLANSISTSCQKDSLLTTQTTPAITSQQLLTTSRCVHSQPTLPVTALSSAQQLEINNTNTEQGSCL